MKFGFLCYPGFEELDLIGPWEIATMWQSYCDGPSCLTVASSTDPVRCAKGLVVVPTHDFEAARDLDFLLVPGGYAAFEEMQNTATLDYLNDVASRAKTVLSVCTGSFILQAAGLLDGVPAATHWLAIDRLRGLGVEVVEERYVQTDRIWSSSGVSAGIDMMLAFVAEQAGEDVAATVQFQSEYFPDGKLYGEPARHAQAPEYVRRLAG